MRCDQKKLFGSMQQYPEIKHVEGHHSFKTGKNHLFCFPVLQVEEF